ncbi:MAG: glycine--tRNA ligase subunit beta [Pseudomonadota bacterium]
MPDLLLELFSEEIPARMQARAAEDLKRLVSTHMAEAGLKCGDGRAYATPRRLVLALPGLPGETPEQVEERKGPRTDAPEKAIEGFLRSTGLTKDDLEVRDDKKGQVYFAVMRKPGRTAEDVVATAVEAAMRNFPWPKSMRWGAGSLRWVRPLHSILCVLSDEVGARAVPIEIDGIAAGDRTEGHRFLSPGSFAVTSFDDYAEKLAAAHVVLDPADRMARIEADAAALAAAEGLEVVPDKGLLAEVAGLVEWPVVLMGTIDDEFLDLPPEVLQTSMKEHQKFFSVRNPKTRRIERFITVANRTTADDGATILKGNQKVLSARLSDAKFFWENDLRTVDRGGMDALAEPLKSVTFHNKLGTQWERIERIASLAAEIAPAVGASPEEAAEAARVCKADLSSEMVYEFPELQGVMGRYYTARAGLAEAVSKACEGHYAPLGPSDDVPVEPVSVAVALADKIDMLTGFWAIDEKPTGSKDPFALRRAALGVIRTVLENDVRPALFPVFSFAFVPHRTTAAAGKSGFEPSIDRVQAGQDLLNFIADRLKVYLRDQGIRHDVIQACFDLGGQDDLVLLVNRVRALQKFLETEDGANLLAGYKRASNIVVKAEEDQGPNVVFEGEVEPKLFEQDEERALFAALDGAEPSIAAALEAEDFARAMGEMATLRAPIDTFFEKVTVNAENQITRRNRLCLLTRVRTVMRQVAVWEAIEG